MKRMMLGLMLVLANVGAQAAAAKASPTLPLQPTGYAGQCALVDKAADDAEIKAMARGAQIAHESLPLLARMSAISNKAKIPTVPIDKQLSATDLDHFNRLRVQLLYLEYESVESSRVARDMGILKHLCRASMKINGLWKTYLTKHGMLDPAFPAWVSGKEAALARQEKRPVYLQAMLYLQSQIPSDEQKMLTQVARTQKMLKAGKH